LLSYFIDREKKRGKMTDNRLFIAAYSALPEKVEALVEAGADATMVAAVCE
jgi:hypothetical protein